MPIPITQLLNQVEVATKSNPLWSLRDRSLRQEKELRSCRILLYLK
ncbi:MAG: hypothetical protein AB4372_20850 [Xenococcus sp. (in: cyanobacteria)]